MKRLLQFSRYFFYFFFNYSPVLAFCLIADEIKGERKYGIKSSDFHQVKSFHDLVETGAYSYMPSNYKLLENVLRFINTLPHNHSFLDIGCGKGRTLAVAATFGFNNVTGIEMIERYCLQAKEQLNLYQTRYPTFKFEVVCGDASNYQIAPDVQTIFLYNPFEEWVLRRVVHNVLISLKEAPRHMYVIYVNPCFPYALLDAGFKEIYQASRFIHLKASVFALTD